MKSRARGGCSNALNSAARSPGRRTALEQSCGRLVEAANALRKLEPAGKLPASEASAAYADMLPLNIELQPFEPCAEVIWELRHAVCSYDAWHVAVAEALGMPLATHDGRLVRANGPRCRFITAD